MLLFTQLFIHAVYCDRMCRITMLGKKMPFVGQTEGVVYTEASVTWRKARVSYFDKKCLQDLVIERLIDSISIRSDCGRDCHCHIELYNINIT